MTCVDCKHFDGFDAIRSTLINCDLYGELSKYDAEDMCLGFEEKEKMSKLYEISCTVDDLCYMDYYDGHGHAFADESLIGCMTFSPYVNRHMTNQEIENEIINQVNGGEPDIINPEYEDLIRNIPDQEFRDAFKAEILGESTDKPFKNMKLGPDCQLIGYFHIDLTQGEN